MLDLFAGAGGMSLGFTQTGKYEIAVAVEKNENAQKTYKLNHSDTEILSDILDITDYDKFREIYGEFDIVVGGPPCQGFSNANRQKNHIVSQNNSLVKKYVEVILNLRPKAFIMENVRMLRSEIHRFYCSRNDGYEVERLGIATRNETICLLDLICPVEDFKDYLFNTHIISKLILPEKSLYALRMLLKNSRNEKKREEVLDKQGKKCIKIIALMPSKNVDVSRHYVDFERIALNKFIQFAGGEISFDEAEPLMSAYINVQRLLLYAKELLDSDIILSNLRFEQKGVYVDVKSYSVIDYINKRLGEHYNISDSVLNAAWYGVPQLRERYIALGLRNDLDIQPELPKAEFASAEYHTVCDAISDLEIVTPCFTIEDNPVYLDDEYLATPLTAQLRNADILTNHIATETREKAMKRFEALQPGQNFHDLDRSLIEDTYTRPERTQNSIYLRLVYDKPSGTVTNVRKSMWIHPVLNRAISIREAARLQSFPDSFIFVGTKDSQYQQVGNAVPPIMAKAIAIKLAELLDACNLDMDE
ncbi:DNA cytosine methyltransferase [Paenibacillus odorifer]|nr:DNA cytosine methyltransferase [Paenibacillus odorifer]